MTEKYHPAVQPVNAASPCKGNENALCASCGRRSTRTPDDSFLLVAPATGKHCPAYKGTK